jgi:hypothetical protein
MCLTLQLATILIESPLLQNLLLSLLTTLNGLTVSARMQHLSIIGVNSCVAEVNDSSLLWNGSNSNTKRYQ